MVCHQGLQYADSNFIALAASATGIDRVRARALAALPSRVHPLVFSKLMKDKIINEKEEMEVYSMCLIKKRNGDPEIP